MQTQKKSRSENKNLQMLILIVLIGSINLAVFKLTRHNEKNAEPAVAAEKPGVASPGRIAEIPGNLFNDSNETRQENRVFSIRNSFHPPELHPLQNVVPPVPALTEKPFTQQVENSRGAFIKYKSGTQIIIPPGAFVDRKGKEIVGDVDIAYKEFRNAYDFFISGIPMTLDADGKTFQLESAGMMELTASLNNAPVYMNSGKKIRINLASDTREQDYSLYFFDRGKGNWVNKGKDAVRVITDTVRNADVNAAAPLRSVMYAYEPLTRGNFTVYCSAYTPAKRLSLFSKTKRTGEFIFRFKSEMFTAYTEFKPFRSSGWMYKDKDAAEVYEKLFRKKFEKNHSASVNDYWNGVSLSHETGTDEFVFSFYSDADSLVIPVYAVQGNMKITSETSTPKLLMRTENKYYVYKKGYERIFGDETVRYKKYREDSAKFIAQGGRITDPTITTQVVRSFEVDGFGIWNCDRFAEIENAVTMRVKFVDPENNELQFNTVYLVDKRLNSILTYYPAGFNKFRFNPGVQNVIWAILPDNRLAYVDPTDFETISKGDKEHIFKMKVVINAVDGMKEVRKTFRI